jgi:hypothetical protein
MERETNIGREEANHLIKFKECTLWNSLSPLRGHSPTHLS